MTHKVLKFRDVWRGMFVENKARIIYDVHQLSKTGDRYVVLVSSVDPDVRMYLREKEFDHKCYREVEAEEAVPRIKAAKGYAI